MKRKIIALILLLALTLTGCKKNNDKNGPANDGGITNDNTSYGEDLKDLGAYDGFFEGEKSDIVVNCVSGTPGCYKLEGGVLTFTSVSEDSVYSVAGKLSGSIVIDIGDDFKFDLELVGFSLVSSESNPILILSGDEVDIQAKKDTKSFIYDTRAAIPEDDTTSLSGAIHSEVDLDIGGKGSLTVVSENNNGIHSKKDLQVKNLNLTVSCKDNALKGNDSVSLEGATATLIATVGDCIKTTNSDISSKGNQRGTVSVISGSYELYAACDGIDAAYDVVIDGEDTELNIYTDRYSNYSEEVTTVSDNLLFIRFNYSDYNYSVKYYNSDSDYLWVNAEYHSTASGSRYNYYYHSFPKNADYSKLQFFIYDNTMTQGQESDYVAKSDYITISDAYDTLALSVRGQYLYYDWTNYTTSVSDGFGGMGPGGMGPGGMDGGNTDKGDHSTKGIKAANQITLSGGNINIKSYDDALHANADVALENGETPTGNLPVNGGSLTVYSNDDGLHADGSVTVNGGSVNVVSSYEGIEGNVVNLLGGNVYVIAKDDGVNATATSGTSITVGGGLLYIYCGGDGIDSNSRTSYSGIAFTGGKSLIISTSGGNSAIDSEQGYSYSGGSVVALMPRGAMTNEATHCANFSSIGKWADISISAGQFLVAEIGGDKLTAKMSAGISGYAILLGDSGASVSAKSSSSHELKEGEFIWE